jgi:hypothetical protein
MEGRPSAEFLTSPIFIADSSLWLYLGCDVSFHPGALSMNFLAMLLQDTMQNPQDAVPHQVQQVMMMMIPIIAVAVIIGMAVILIPFWFICKKAGFSPWLTLLNLLPGGGLVLVYVLAFADWKVVPAPQILPYPPPYQPPYPPVPPGA